MAQDQPSLDFQSHVDEAYEILKRLTVKDLCEIRLVSRIWKNMITADDFKTLHHSWLRKNPLLLIVTPPQIIQNYLSSDDEYQQVEELFEDFEIVDENHTEYPLVLTSVNPTDGEVMYQKTIQTCGDFEVLSSGRGCLFCIRNSVNYSIFNATTKKIHKLPEADPPNAVASGFGYIKSEKTYVIVKLLYGLCQIIKLSETGEMITPSWKTIEEKSPFNVSGNAGIMVGKACYWMDDQTLRLPITMRILCLDLDSEMFYRVDYPAPESYKKNHDMHIGELDNMLFMTDTFSNILKMDIWVRENGRFSEWEMKYQIDLSLIHGFDDVFGKPKLIGYILEEDQDTIMLFQNSQHTEMFYYDVEARRFRNGHQFQVGNNLGNIMYPYSEKFSSIRRQQHKKTCS